jgi:glutamyl-tRNA synthetase
VDVVSAFRERSKTLREMAQKSAFLFQEPETYEEKAAQKHLDTTAESCLQSLYESLTALGKWQAEAIHGAVNQVSEVLGLKLAKVAQPLRVAVTGTAESPPIDVTLELLGRTKTLGRIQRALDFIHQRTP